MKQKKQDTTFKEYADYYDAFYKNKDYVNESEFLFKVIKKYSSIKIKDILSLGCGTASHDIVIAQKGFNIYGIDKSEEMIKIAKEKAYKANVDIKLKVSDITDFRLDRKFDFAMAMFNVVGYLTKNEEMERFLKNVNKSLKKDALLVFDGWYGPAVLKDRPSDKTKEILINGKNIIRQTKQKLDTENSKIIIDFSLSEHLAGNIRSIAKERHETRFWYLLELKYFLNKNGFELIQTCNFLDIDSEISEYNWNIFIIAKKCI